MSHHNSANSTSWGSSSADEPILAELANRPKRPWLVFVAGLLVLLFIVGLVVGPLIYYAMPGEIARWRIASAEEKRANGDLAGALQDLDKALAEDPNNVQLLRTRANWRSEKKDFNAALEDIDTILKLRPDDERTILKRIDILQSMGKHADAVAVAKQLLKTDRLQKSEVRANKLNLLAYSRALANIEIDEGLIDIDEAIRISGEQYQLIDTRGFLYYRDGDYERALNDLNRAVERAEEEYAQWQETTNKGQFGTLDPRERDFAVRERARLVAVVRYHRALIHEALGNDDKAKIDNDRVRELGFEPSEELF